MPSHIHLRLHMHEYVHTQLTYWGCNFVQSCTAPYPLGKMPPRHRSNTTVSGQALRNCIAFGMYRRLCAAPTMDQLKKSATTAPARRHGVGSRIETLPGLW